MDHSNLILGGLALVMALVLVLPFSVRRVEEELEGFLLVMGCAALTLSGGWTREVVEEALKEPLRITAAVLLFGLAFRRWLPKAAGWVRRLNKALGVPGFLFCLVVGLGLASSVVTAIIAALILVEVITVLKLPRETERRLVVLACFSIGLGAALTPIGEPLSTITTARLAGPPHEAGFFFLAGLLWPWLLPGILALGAGAAWLGARSPKTDHGLKEDERESTRTILMRAARVYVFVAALVLLGTGLSPLEEKWLASVPAEALYWVNMSSAALDNATLAAAEISSRLDAYRIRAILLGLLASGGMLIPGNIPNIIAANKLRIGSRDWARSAVPVGLLLMAVFFAGLMLGARP